MELILFKIFIISWFISRFEPIHMALEALPNKLVYNLIRLILTCLKCLAFWITLTWTQDIFLASLMAFIGFWYDKIIGRIENKVRL
jgi:hypothetical protein